MIGTRETGNETYVVRVAQALSQLGGYDYRLYTPRPDTAPEELRRGGALRLRSFPDVPAAIRMAWLYPRLVRQDRVSLFHFTFSAPPRLACPFVLSVHDLSYRIFPRYFSPRVRLILALLVGSSIQRAGRIVTLSESARHDIMRFYGVPARRIAVTPLAAGPRYVPQPRASLERVRHAYRLPQRYVLAVGNVQPRKNLPRLIAAFARLARHSAELGLVIAGQRGWRGSEAAAIVACLGLAGQVRFLGYVPEEDLPALYGAATVFCYPSLYEGFGLPPLEAMACGVPTVTSNVSSLPEVVADAALQVNPLSVEAIAAALQRFLDDEAMRQEYGSRGLARAALFSWEQTAVRTRAVYDAVLAEQG
jgi:glycosyltransferase involved in cell wall biosynthesis